MVRVAALLTCLLTAVCCYRPTSAEEPPPYKRLLTGEDAKKVAELDKKTAELEQAGKYAEAIQAAEELLALRTKVQGPDHWETADQKWALVTLQKVATLPEEKRPGWRKAAAGAAEAERLEQQAQYVKALGLRQKDLNWCQEVLGETHAETATCYNNVALNLNAQGKYAEAEPLLRKALYIRRQALGEAHPNMANSHNNVAGNLSATGKYAEAEPLFRKAVDINRQVLGEAHPSTANSYNNVAYNLVSQGKYAEAEPLLRKALDIRRQALGEAHPHTAASYNNVAYILNTQAKYAHAEPLFRKALDIYRQALGEAHPHTAGGYNNVASNLNAQSKYAEAEAVHRKALNIRRQALGEAHADTAQSYANVAHTLDAQWKCAEAEPLYRKALDIYRQALGEAHPSTALAYINVGFNLNAQEKFTEAEVSFRKALDISRQALGEAHPSTARSYKNVAANLNAQGKYAEAEPLAGAAVTSLEAARLHAATTGLGRAAGQRIEPRRFWAAALLHLSRPAHAWQAMEGHLGRGLLDDVASRSGLQLPPADQRKLEQITARLAQCDKQIGDIFNRKGRLEEDKEQFEQLAAQRNKMQEELSQFAAELNRREVYDLKRIQQQLPRDVALICWLDLGYGPATPSPPAPLPQGGEGRKNAGEHWAFLLKASGEPIVVRLSGSGKDGAWTKEDDELPAKVRAWVTSPQRKQGDADALAGAAGSNALYRQRFGSLEPHLQDVKHLVVLPSTALQGIPIEALTDRFLVSYATSGTLLTRLAEKRQGDKEKRSLLAVGDPVFLPPEKPKEGDADKLLAGLSRGPTLAPLPGTRREVEAIAALFPRSEKLLGHAAQGTAVRQLAADGSLGKFDVIHLATHSLTDPYTAFQSAIVLSQAADDTGKLTALEMKDWKLNADLVVLSACESALGKHSGGEGYLGFSQALFLAGARSIILSLWPVSDTATALLMVRFYENWLGRDASGGSRPRLAKAEALKEAKHWLRNLSRKHVEERIANLPETARGLKLEPPAGINPAAREEKPFAHPYYWSAFILIGDPE